jgi:hypothetical protein
VPGEAQRPSQRKRNKRLAVIRDVLVIAFIILFAWKLLNANISLNLSGFAFSDLLSLLLALFSVWLSVAFYLKASDTSNKFYDNTYRFTSNISELLGRIEERFGERLRHLDDGYPGIKDRFERWQEYVTEPASLDIQREKEEIRLIEEKKQQIIDQFAARAQIAESERETLKEQLDTVTQELPKATIAMSELMNSDRRGRESSPSGRLPRPGSAALFYIARKIHESDPFVGAEDLTVEDVADLFRKTRPRIAAKALEDLQRVGLIDEAGNMAEQALQRIRRNLCRLEA